MENLKSQEQLKAELSAPLPTEAVTPHPTKPYLSSIKAIYVAERLNDVFGIGKWNLKSEVVERADKGVIVVQSVLTIPEYGIQLESFGGNDNGGEGSKNFDLGDAYKGATTDALTKICSYLEIGIDVFKGKQQGTAPRPPKPTAPASTAKPAETAKATPATKTPTKPVEAAQAQTGTPAAGMAPNEKFDEPAKTAAPEGKVEPTEEEKRATLLTFLNKVGAAKVLAHLLKVEKMKYTSVGDFVASESIDTIKAVYEKVRPVKK